MIYKAILSEQIASINKLLHSVADDESIEGAEYFLREVRKFSEHEDVDKERLSFYLERLEHTLMHIAEDGAHAEEYARSFMRQCKSVILWMQQSLRNKKTAAIAKKWRQC